jgi:hypothetical protein
VRDGKSQYDVLLGFIEVINSQSAPSRGDREACMATATYGARF